MKVRYIGSRQDPLSLMSGHVYECTGYVCEMHGQLEDVYGPVRGKTMLMKIIDEDEDEYLYPAEWFEKLK